MDRDIYHHFHPSERDWVDLASDWIERVELFHEQKLTDFLDPRQSYILETLISRSHQASVRLDGGHAFAERRRALIAPDYTYMDELDMQLRVLAITSDDRQISELEHGDYLGAILGMGIKRSKIGDIHVLDDGCHVLVAADMASFMDIHLQQVHRVQVQTELLPLKGLRISQTELASTNVTVSSMRLDGIASAVYGVSRSKILVPIRSGRCRVNWKMEDNPSTLVQVGDIVSMQGLGRFKILDTDGMTKKGKYRVNIGKFS